jgi:hypothetical protein
MTWEILHPIVLNEEHRPWTICRIKSINYVLNVYIHIHRKIMKEKMILIALNKNYSMIKRRFEK